MKLLTILSVTLPALAAALPAPWEPLEPEAPVLERALEERALRGHHLKVKVKPGQDASKNRFNGLWIGTYHTGAGLNDIVAWPKKSSSYPVYLNKTRAAFDFGGDFPFGIELYYDAFYTAWHSVQANAGYGDKGFKFDGDKFAVNRNGPGEAPNWGGWRVCDWWHEVPQLFYTDQFYKPIKHDSPACANVDLIKVPN